MLSKFRTEPDGSLILDQGIFLSIFKYFFLILAIIFLPIAILSLFDIFTKTSGVIIAIFFMISGCYGLISLTQKLKPRQIRFGKPEKAIIFYNRKRQYKLPFSDIENIEFFRSQDTGALIYAVLKKGAIIDLFSSGRNPKPLESILEQIKTLVLDQLTIPENTTRPENTTDLPSSMQFIKSENKNEQYFLWKNPSGYYTALFSAVYGLIAIFAAQLSPQKFYLPAQIGLFALYLTAVIYKIISEKINWHILRFTGLRISYFHCRKISISMQEKLAYPITAQTQIIYSADSLSGVWQSIYISNVDGLNIIRNLRLDMKSFTRTFKNWRAWIGLPRLDFSGHSIVTLMIARDRLQGLLKH